jgi:hypothetical protein
MDSVFLEKGEDPSLLLCVSVCAAYIRLEINIKSKNNHHLSKNEIVNLIEWLWWCRVEFENLMNHVIYLRWMNGE